MTTPLHIREAAKGLAEKIKSCSQRQWDNLDHVLEKVLVKTHNAALENAASRYIINAEADEAIRKPKTTKGK